MNVLIRVTAIILVCPATYLFTSLMVILMSSLDESQGLKVFSFLVSLAALWFVWRNTATSHEGVISSILLGTLAVGIVGFLLGFIGPMIFYPDANQGPLLGILVTGPIGFLAGPITGFAFWVYKSRRLEPDQSSA